LSEKLDSKPLHKTFLDLYQVSKPGHAYYSICVLNPWRNFMNDMTALQKDKLMGDLRVVISDAEALLKMTADEMSEGALDIRSRVKSRLDQAKLDLIHLQETAVAKAKAAGHAADEFVHESPWKSIGIAAGAGLVIGLLIGRR
jgi:ElaB/YqjD/DUF883 family membrane-anchored ribosome-binding protein